MRELSIAKARRDAAATVRLLRAAMDPGSDGGSHITPREARAVLCVAERVDARVVYLHEVTAHHHALEREATDLEYRRAMHARLDRAADELPLDAA